MLTLCDECVCLGLGVGGGDGLTCGHQAMSVMRSLKGVAFGGVLVKSFTIRMDGGPE